MFTLTNAVKLDFDGGFGGDWVGGGMNSFFVGVEIFGKAFCGDVDTIGVDEVEDVGCCCCCC